MKDFIKVLVLTLVLTGTNICNAKSHLVKYDEHNIYYYDFNIKNSRLEIIKALDNKGIGTENVLSAAKRHSALAAINGGFFHYNGSNHGIPAGLLVTGENYFLSPGIFEVFYVNQQNKINFASIVVDIFLHLGKESLKGASINKPRNEGVVIYTPSYWSSTLTLPGTTEIIAKDNKVVEINDKGNNPIPNNGFVISVMNPALHSKLKNLTAGASAVYEIELLEGKKKLNLDSIKYLINGSDLMIVNNEILPKITALNDSSSFRDEPHGRTAICQYDEENYGLFIVDHNPAREAYNITVRELAISLKQHGYTREQVLAMTNGQLLEAFNKLQKSKDRSIGIAIPKFATWLKKQGCINAINLDGGGSATMVVKNKVINSPTGLNNNDVEAKNLREVGDIILIKSLRQK